MIPAAPRWCRRFAVFLARGLPSAGKMDGTRQHYHLAIEAEPSPVPRVTPCAEWNRGWGSAGLGFGLVFPFVCVFFIQRPEIHEASLVYVGPHKICTTDYYCRDTTTTVVELSWAGVITSSVMLWVQGITLSRAWPLFGVAYTNLKPQQQTDK